MKKMGNYKQENIRRWGEKINSLFPKGRPTRCEWTNLGDIVEVLNVILEDGLANILYSDGGDITCKLARSSTKEVGCIEVYEENTRIIFKTEKLVFLSCQEDYDKDYFVIETNKLTPKGSTNNMLGCNGNISSYEKYTNHEIYTDNTDYSNVRRILKGNMAICAKHASIKI